MVSNYLHDYQGISTGFRGDGVAFPSDQGLGILDGDNNTLINAVGDLHNNMALSALISPSKDGKSRNIVVNLWDWNQAFSIDDGATWRGWATALRGWRQIGRQLQTQRCSRRPISSLQQLEQPRQPLGQSNRS